VHSSVAPAAAAEKATPGWASGATALERARAYLFATRRHLMYGAGDAFSSDDFGLAPRR